LLKSKAEAASIRCRRAMNVRVVKIQIAIPFFLKRGAPSVLRSRVNLNSVSYYIIVYSNSEIFYRRKS
jgi:hypothetical protein